MKTIILASGSPRRKELLDQMGLAYDIIVSDVDESGLDHMEPAELVQALASLKAQAVAEELLSEKEDALVIGADTLVVLNDQILGKPTDNLDAEKMLSILSGKMHMVYTGVSIVDTKNNTEETFVQSSKIYMKDMSPEEIKAYVLTKEPLDKAGSYGIQGKGGVFVEKIEGDYFSVMGLPIAKLYEQLKNYR
ncbi:MAG TPA: septum formation inhibitor Maf [Epulopiscium sp.]|nr:septum formation inhibitor Maf [Candidatus Epulonipiscium sp.]